MQVPYDSENIENMVADIECLENDAKQHKQTLARAGETLNVARSTEGNSGKLLTVRSLQVENEG